MKSSESISAVMKQQRKYLRSVAKRPAESRIISPRRLSGEDWPPEFVPIQPVHNS